MSLNRILAKLRGRSAGEIARLTLASARHGLVAQLPAMRRASAADRAFDRQWGTDTSDHVGVRDLGFAPDRAAQAVQYQPSAPGTLTDAMGRLGIDPAEWHFIDYGAGKGRIVMTAMQLGFARVTGVELSEQLCVTARANIAKFAAQQPALAPALIECTDATAFVPDGERILAYFYNPFGAPILAEVRDRLAAALGADTWDICVIYANPVHLEVFTAAPGWNTARIATDIAVARAGRQAA